MNKKISFVITDIVRDIRSSKIYKKVRRQGERFWVIKCSENTVRVFQSEFTDQQFIEMLENKTAIGRKVRFSCQSFWKHVLQVEILGSE